MYCCIVWSCSSSSQHAQANAVSLLRLADAALKEASPRLVIPAENTCTITISSNSEVADKKWTRIFSTNETFRSSVF